VSDDVSRLYMSKPEATARLRGQIERGQGVHRAIGHATALGDLQELRSRLSRWSQRNEQVLASIFGEPERAGYRSAGLPRTMLWGFSARQAQMERVVSSRIAYLESAVARVDLGPGNQADHAVDKKPWWRVMLDHPWTIALAAPVIAAPLITVIALAVTGSAAGSTMLTGTVACESGRPVAGVWIAASTGQSDSGLAHVGSAAPSGIIYPAGSIASYSYLLPHGGTYAVHVGCGEKVGAWDSSNYSPLLSGHTADLRCDDPTTLPAHGITPHGLCTTISGTA
jgi:hypothetical protein